MELRHDDSDGCTNGCRCMIPLDLQRVMVCWDRLPDYAKSAISQLCKIVDSE